MGKTKVECKKLDYLTETQKCVFCGTSEIDEMKYGPVYSHKNIITHYYCLLLSSNMEQNGRDCDGILGFLPNDISREVKRGARLHCSYCRANGATLGCAITKCKVVFHLPCGMKHGTLHQFFGEFRSFCNKHRPVQSISEKILANSSKGAICGICYDKVVPRPVHETLWAPCCQKNAFFHRVCVQRLAISAGYFFKCPLCNNTTLFQQTMKEFGIYIPEQDASWECVPHAYQDLLVRHDTCDSANCSCPEGRKTNVPGTRWELILCKFCGSQGIHIGCGRLKWKSPEFECDICSKAATQEGNTRNSGSRHRLSGSNRSAHVPTSIPADRDKEESDESSNDSTALMISNRRMRIRSPVPEQRPKTPPHCKPIKKHRHERYEKSHDCENKNDKEKKHENSSCIIIDDDLEEKLFSRSILIDDSDDEVEFVTEPKFNFNQSNSTSLKSFDGKTIPVVHVDSKGRKRFRAVGDIDVDSAEVVDISIQMPGPVKKPKFSSPPPIQELVYTFPQLQTQPSSSQSVPSTSFAPPDYSRYVLVDSSTLRHEDLVPGTVVYRSVQPLVQPVLQHTGAQPPPQPQPQPQSSSMPMQQQLGPSYNADAQYSDLSKHWTGSSYHFSSGTPPSALCVQKCAKKAPRRSIKCDSTGRRGGRHPRCDNYRLNPQVLISRLRCRISFNGHFEFIVPWENLNSHIFLKKKSALPFRPMKKIKLTTKNNVSKCKLLEKAVSPATINTILDKPKKRITKTKQNKSQSKQTIKVKIPICNNQEITSYYNPRKLKTNKKKNKKISENCIDYSSKRKKKDENYGVNDEVMDSANNVSLKSECKGRKTKKRRVISLEQWKYKTIDQYLKKIEKLSTFQNDTNQPISLDNYVDFEQKSLSFVSMKSEELDDIDAVLNISKEEPLVPKVIFNEAMFSSDKCQDNINNDESSYNIDCSDSTPKHNNKNEPDNVVDSALTSSKNESLVSEDSSNYATQTFEIKIDKDEIHSDLNKTESSFKDSNKSDSDKFENPALNLSATELPPVHNTHNTVSLTNKFEDKTVNSEHEYSLNLTDSVSKYSITLLDDETSLNSKQVLPEELLNGYVNTNKNVSVCVNNHNSLPSKTGLESSDGYCLELTNSNKRNSPWSWTESSSTLSNALEIEISLEKGNVLPTDSILKHRLVNMKNNDPVFENCHKSLVEPSTRSILKSIDNKHTLDPNEVNKYKKNAINKETEDCFLLHIVDTLNLNAEQDLLDNTLTNQNHKPCDLQLSQDDSATQTNSSCKGATHLEVKDTNSSSIVETDRPCGEVGQDKNLSINEIPITENTSNKLSEMACLHSENGNNSEKQVMNSLFRNQGFFPRIKIGKSTKSNVSNKKCNKSEMKLKHMNKYKCGKKVHKENVNEIELHNKKYKYLSKGAYSLDAFFISKKKELSSTAKAAELTASNTLSDETSNDFLPTLSSKTISTETGSPGKAEQKPLYELKFNKFSKFC